MGKILVVDDSSFQRKSICGLIESVGYETVQAKNGQEALERLEESEYDCIFCDLLMPVMNGSEFLEELQKQDTHPPVVILTADKQKTSQENVMELGAIKFLNKPPKAEEISETIKELLSK